MNKENIIPMFHERVDWQRTPVLSINCAPWGDTYNPEAQAQLAFLQGQGFAVRMACREQSPVAMETAPDTPVFLDSCMESFLHFRPDSPQHGYLNFEVNANGTMLAQYGLGRAPRTYLLEAGCSQPDVQVSKDENGWQIEYLIELPLLQHWYGPLCFEAGKRVRANFYKCGSRTAPPHHLCWSPIDTPAPDFHAPQFFGELVLVEG